MNWLMEHSVMAASFMDPKRGVWWALRSIALGITHAW